jgi:TRAP-type C4-dicarboxylate transport system substrate-binding protein
MKFSRTILALMTIFTVFGTAAAGPVTLRIATVAPDGSSFHKSLQQLNQQWSKAPGGGVSLAIYTQGKQGSEAQIASRMRAGSIQGAMLTANGLGQLDKDATALQLMPMMFRSWEEVDHVREALRARLEQGLYDAGYVVIFWGDAGWVRFFSRSPIAHPADLKRMRVYADGGDPVTLDLMREYYTPVPLAPHDIQLSLRNGTIDAIPVPAFLANLLQVAQFAPNMLDMRWVPIAGAMVVTRKSFDALPAETREYMLRTGREAGAEIRRQARAEDDAAVEAMRTKQKLNVVPFPPALEQEWRKELARLSPQIRGQIVPADIFDRVGAALQDYRSHAPAGLARAED